MPVLSQGGREGSQGNRKGAATFSLLSNELKNLIWEETFSQQRIFDDDTLRILNAQNGVMYSYLTPYALFVCHASQEFAQGRLRRSYLFKEWPRGIGRVIYFRPECDVRVYQMTQLHWRQDGHCLFSCVKIIADVSPEDLTSDIGFGLRSAEFREKFPSLKKVIVTDRQLNLYGEIIRHRWTEERWQRESSVYQNDWDRDWKVVEKIFEESGIRIQRSSDQPETDIDKKRYIRSFQTCPALRDPVTY